MDLFEAMEKRFSYRGEFKNQEIPKEDILKIMKAAIQAPSGLNTQTTNFVVVQDAAARAKLNEIFPHKGIGTAPVVLVVTTKRIEVYQGVAFEMQDYAAAVENVLLAVTALGYATVWTDGETATDGRPAKVAKLLDIPADETVRALLPIGVPTGTGSQKAKKPIEERVRFV